MRCMHSWMQSMHDILTCADVQPAFAYMFLSGSLSLLWIRSALQKVI